MSLTWLTCVGRYPYWKVHTESKQKVATRQSSFTIHFQLWISRYHIDGLGQHCSISSKLAMEILQSCTKSSTWLFQCMSIQSHIVVCKSSLNVPECSMSYFVQSMPDDDMVFISDCGYMSNLHQYNLTHCRGTCCACSIVVIWAVFSVNLRHWSYKRESASAVLFSLHDGNIFI